MTIIDPPKRRRNRQKSIRKPKAAPAPVQPLPAILEIVEVTTPTRTVTVTLHEGQKVTCSCGGFILYLDCAHARQVRQERGIPDEAA